MEISTNNQDIKENLRKYAVDQVLREKRSISEIAKELKVSRKAIYAWINRYKEAPKSLKQSSLRSRYKKGKDNPRAIDRKVKYQLIRLINKHPEWGCRKLSIELTNVGYKVSHFAIYCLLKELGATEEEKRKNFNRNWSGPGRLSKDIKYSIVNKALEEKITINKLSREYGVARKTIYNWIKRYQRSLEKGVIGARSLEEKYAKAEDNARSVDPKLEERLLNTVLEDPKLTIRKLANRVSTSSFTIWKLLDKNNLNNYEKRVAYSQKAAEKDIQPASIPFIDKKKSVFEQFMPTLAPAPPPAEVISTKKTPDQLLKILIASTVTTLSLTLVSIYWINLVVGSTVPQIIGYSLALLALFVGTIFFLYSLKYYVTLAIVLSFSQQGGMREIEKGNGGKRGFLSRILGLAKGNGEQRSVGPVGLTPNLEHITIKRYPYISIHVPFYNEKNVAKRLLNATTNFDYKGEYEVIIADDSTDETINIVREYQRQFLVKGERLKQISGEGWTLTQVEVRPGVILKHLHRTTRSGFKGGALALALKLVNPKTEFVSVFDADFVPYPDTLQLFLKYFKVQNNMSEDYTKTNVAVVQGYQWHVLNKSENWITRGVRNEYAGSYVIERPGREILGALKQISGSVYMIRHDVLQKLGWGTSITEDFQLTLRLYEAGYKVVFTPYIQAPAECVSTIRRLIRQRMRWSEGHSNNVRRMFLRLVLNPKLTVSEKIEFLYLTPYYLQAFFFVVGTIAWLTSEAIFKVKLPFWTALWGWSLVLTNLLSLPLMNAVGLFLEEAEEKDYVGILSFIALSYILVPFQAFASLKGFIRKEEGPWFRTPKTGKITDVFARGRFYRFIAGILPRRKVATIPATADISEKLSPNFVLNVASNIIPRKRKHVRLLTKSVAVFSLIICLTISSLAGGVTLFLNDDLLKDSGNSIALAAEDSDGDGTKSNASSDSKITVTTTPGVEENISSLDDKLTTEVGPPMPSLDVSQHNSSTHPEDYYISIDELVEIEEELDNSGFGSILGSSRDVSSSEKYMKALDLVAEDVDTNKIVNATTSRGREEKFVPYYVRKSRTSYQIITKAEEGYQMYEVGTDSLDIKLFEINRRKDAEIRAVSGPIYEYRDNRGEWVSYEVGVPTLELDENSKTATVVQKYNLFATQTDDEVVKASTELKVGFTGEKYINKLTFKIEDNHNFSRVKWDSHVYDLKLTEYSEQNTQGSEVHSSSEVQYENLTINWGDFISQETAKVKDEEKRRQVCIDFNSNNLTQATADRNGTSTIFYPEGKQGGITIDPTISATVASTTVKISVADEFEIEMDAGKGGVIDSWYDLENDSGKTDQLANTTDGLFDFYTYESSTARTISGDSAATQEVIEVSDSRAVVEYTGELEGATNYDYVLTYTVYATGDIYIKLDITNNTGSSVTWNPQRAEITVDSVTNHTADGDGVASNGDAMTVGTNNWVKWVGDGTTKKDAAILYHYSGFAYLEYYTSSTKVAFERDTNESQADGEVFTRVFKLQLRPDTDIMGTGETEPDNYSNEYWNPDTLTYTTGSQWYDITGPSPGLDFDGSDDYVDMGTSDPGINGLSNITFSIWLSLDKVTGTQAIHQKNDLGESVGWATYLTNDSMGFYDGSANRSLDVNLTTFAWTHLAWVYSSGTVYYYKNGTQIDTTTGQAASLTDDSSASFCIGIRCYDSAEQLDGLIDDVRIYDTNLTQSQIRQVMSGDISVASANLVGLWNLNENQSDTANDSSGNNNNGDLAGSGGSCPGASACPAWTTGYVPDQYNEAEGAYTIDAATSTTYNQASRVDIDIDGGTYTRHKPAYKIRNWRSPDLPAAATLEGHTLYPGTSSYPAENYSASLKPFSDAYFAQDLTWHSTMESSTGFTSPDVGTGGSASTATFTTGKYGKGMLIDGSETPYTLTSDNISATAGIVEFWYKNTQAMASDGRFFMIDNDAGLTRMSFQRDTADTNLKFELYDGAAKNNQWQSTNVNVFDGEWHHLRLIYDSATDAPELWIDGQEETRDTTEAWSPPTLGSNIYIGNRDDGLRPINGIIDEFRIYQPATNGINTLAEGGDTDDADEYLADTTSDYTFDFNDDDANNRGEYFWLGSDSKFTGVNYKLTTAGTGSSEDFDWEYWDGTSWSALTTYNETANANTFETTNGSYYFVAPYNWNKYSVNGSTDLYYLRGHLEGGTLSDFTESVFYTDILLFQYQSNIFLTDQTFTISSDPVRQSGGSIQIDVPNRYRMIMDTGDTTDMIAFYDRYEDDDSPDYTYEIVSTNFNYSGTGYSLRYDDNRKTTILESNDVRVKIRVEGCAEDGNGSPGNCLTDGDDNILIVEDYTFTTEGVWVDKMIDFRDSGVDLTGDTLQWLSVYADVTDAAFDDTGDIYYGNGEIESSTSSNGSFANTNHYVVFPGDNNYQSAFVGLPNGWIDTNDGDQDWYWNQNGVGTQDLLYSRDRNFTPTGKYYTRWTFQMHPQEDLDTQVERETMINELRLPDELEYTTGSQWYDAPADYGLEFDADNDWVNAGSDTSLDDLTTRTVEAWIYATGWGEGNFGRVFQKYDYGGTGANHTLYVRSSGDLAYSHSWSTGGQWATPGGSITLDRWYHVAVTYNESSTANDPKIYVDGVLQDLDEEISPSGTEGVDANGTFTIGNRNPSDSSRTFDGIIDEFRVWNDERTAQEIFDNMYQQVDSGSSNLVAYWPMDERTGQVITDQTTNNNHGTLGSSTGSDVNDPVWKVGYLPDHYNEAEGAYPVDMSSNQAEFDIDGGYALKFDGSGDYVDVGTGSTIHNLGPLTFTAWYIAPDGGENQLGRFFQSGPDSQGRFLYWWNGDDGDVDFQVDYGTQNLSKKTNTGEFPYNEWAHIAVTWDGTANHSGVHIYRNGVEVSYSGSSQNGTGGLDADTGLSFYLGNRATTTNRSFDGILDEVRLYNTDLSQNQIRSVMYEQINPASSNLVAYWGFDEGSGGSTDDETTNNNDGTITGPTWSSGYWSERHKPFFKFRNYRDNEEPSTITLEGASLTDGTDYSATIKPFSTAYFAQDLLWHSTMESSTVFTSPDVGTGGSASTATFEASKYGYGMRVDASAEKPYFPFSGNMDATQGTVEFWYKNTNTPTAFGKFFENCDTVSVDKFQLYRFNSNTDIYLEINDGSAHQNAWLSTNIDVFDGEWHHVLVNYDAATDVPELWIDGQQETRDTTNGWSAFTPETNVYVGNRGFGDRNIGGVIDEFRVYDEVLQPTDLLAKGGDTSDPNEYLYDEANDYTFDFNYDDANNRGEYVWLGSDSRFQGLNMDLDTDAVASPSAGSTVEINHEGGNLGEYSSTVEDSGDLFVSSSAALAGTSYGLEANIDDTTAIYGEETFTQLTSSEYRYRFYIDPNDLSMANNDEFTVFWSGQSTNTRESVVLKYTTASGYQIKAVALNDSSGEEATSFYTITNAPHYIEVLVHRASSASASDGKLILWIDDVKKEQKTGIDLYDLSQIDRIRVGPSTGLDSGTSGNLYLDEVSLNNSNTKIGAWGIDYNWEAWTSAGDNGAAFPFVNDSSLQGLWYLEEAGDATRLDETTNDNDLVETASDTIEQSPYRRQGSYGADFEAGDTEHLYISDTDQAGLDITGDLSVGAWIWVESDPGSSNYKLITKYKVASGSRAYQFSYSYDGNYIYAYLSGDGEVGTLAYTANSTVPINEWHHAAMVYNGTDMRLYIDGELLANGSNNPKTYSSGIFNSPENFMLGNSADLANDYDGKMDEAFIFSRALSANEIAKIYNTRAQTYAWRDMDVTENDTGSSEFTADGNFYFTAPGNWQNYSVNGSTDLYYIRGHLDSGSYSTDPVENTIKTDILLLQYLSSITSEDQTFVIVPENLWPFLFAFPAILFTYNMRRRKDKIKIAGKR